MIFYGSCFQGFTRRVRIANETADIANQEQLSMSIHQVGVAYEINEDFIGLVHVPRTTSDTLVAAIKER